ncbi:MAG: xanthine dehydrogenase family protein subunit M [Blastocatellia bacterium]|nr:xanthine dehydrogenase family protein subunit M [Blastocatellia bacterium]MCS7156940.1 xanthine dehydrogenase family protein subunit M [Blastocatellia bacterium]MDW8167632.1 xanthine dehydrogenase family protein subunit M [Acidobacteriota bacterium]MDW8256232.1 xanthine dehydrogenase family protein subunit M [Acidobacteriota bacterium]
MIPTTFEYFRPTALSEALALLEQHRDEAKLLAGGHSLIPLMKLRLAQPRYIIDLGGVKELSYIRESGDHLLIGAMTRHVEVETSEVLRQRCPLLAETAHQIGDVQVRNMGTIGGSLAHADPAADYPAAILALGAELRAVSTRGERWIPAEDFFVDMLTTALEPGEILVEVKVPALGPRTGAAYVKVAQKASGYALCGVAVVLAVDSNGVCQDAAVGITGVAPKAYRARAVEDALRGRMLDASTIADASAKAAEGIDPLEDLHASAEYRAHLARVWCRRAIEQARARV